MRYMSEEEVMAVSAVNFVEAAVQLCDFMLNVPAVPLMVDLPTIFHDTPEMVYPDCVLQVRVPVRAKI